MFLLYLIANVVVSTTLGFMGYDVSTWQYWSCIVCVSAAYIAGRLY